MATTIARIALIVAFSAGAMAAARFGEQIGAFLGRITIAAVRLLPERHQLKTLRAILTVFRVIAPVSPEGQNGDPRL